MKNNQTSIDFDTAQPEQTKRWEDLEEHTKAYLFHLFTKEMGKKNKGEMVEILRVGNPNFIITGNQDNVSYQMTEESQKIVKLLMRNYLS